MIRNAAAVLSKWYLRYPFLVCIYFVFLNITISASPIFTESQNSHLYPLVLNAQWCGLRLGSFSFSQALVLALSTLSWIFIHLSRILLQGLGIIAQRWVADTDDFSLACPGRTESWCKGLDTPWVSKEKSFFCCQVACWGLCCHCFVCRKLKCMWIKWIFWSLQQVHRVIE